MNKMREKVSKRKFQETHDKEGSQGTPKKDNNSQQGGEGFVKKERSWCTSTFFKWTDIFLLKKKKVDRFF